MFVKSYNSELVQFDIAICPLIISEINQIYNCISVTLNVSGATFTDYNGDTHPIEIILLAIQWPFVVHIIL